MKLKCVLIVCCLFAVFTITSAYAQDSWNGGAGNWGNRGKWSGGLPGSNSDVLIYSGGRDNVTLDVSPTVNSLTLGGTSNGTTSELTDDGVAQTLAVTNALNVGQTGYLPFYGGSTLSAGASSNNFGAIDLENASSLRVNADLNNSGTLFSSTGLGGGNSVNITGTLTNQASGSVAFVGPGDMAILGGLTNSGQVQADDGSTLQINGSVINSGGLAAAARGANTLNITGTLMNQPGGILVLNYASDKATIGGSVTNNGVFRLLGGGSTAIMASLNNASSVLVRSGSELQVNGDVNNSGSLQSINVSGGANKIDVKGTLTNSGSFTLNHPGDSVSLGSLNNSGLLLLYGDSNMLQIDGDVKNSSNIYIGGLGGGNRVNIAGSLTNLNNGQFDDYGANDITHIGGNVTNYGFFSPIGNGSTVSMESLDNAGIVDVDRGSTLLVKGDVTNSGMLETDALKYAAEVGCVLWLGPSADRGDSQPLCRHF